MKVWQKNVILIALVVLLAAFPLWYWFEPLSEPASGEVESLLFALQAALGSGVVCFVLGRITARKPEESKRV